MAPAQANRVSTFSSVAPRFKQWLSKAKVVPGIIKASKTSKNFKSSQIPDFPKELTAVQETEFALNYLVPLLMASLTKLKLELSSLPSEAIFDIFKTMTLIEPFLQTESPEYNLREIETNCHRYVPLMITQIIQHTLGQSPIDTWQVLLGWSPLVGSGYSIKHSIQRVLLLMKDLKHH